MIVPGLEKAIQSMVQETGNRRRYNLLRFDAGTAFMDYCAAESGASSARLTASFKRNSYAGKKEWMLELKGSDSIEAGTRVPNARQLGAERYMKRALQRTAFKLPAMADAFFQVTGRGAGFHVSG